MKKSNLLDFMTVPQEIDNRTRRNTFVSVQRGYFFYFSLALSLIKSLLNNIGNNNFLNSNGPGMDPWGVPAAAEPFHSLFSH
jgi:hypothetical protein